MIFRDEAGDVPALLERVAAWVRAERDHRAIIDLTCGWDNDAYQVYIYSLPRDRRRKGAGQ